MLYENIDPKVDLNDPKVDPDKLDDNENLVLSMLKDNPKYQEKK